MVFVDLFRDLQIGTPDILKQFGELRAYGRVLVEEELCKHCLVDRNHLLQIGSMEVHDLPAAKKFQFDCAYREISTSLQF